MRASLLHAILGLAVAWSLPLPCGAQDLPRYKLSVGQELRYEGYCDRKDDGGGFREQRNWAAWVVRQNPDGSWRIVFQNQVTYNSEPRETTIALFDLFPDGRFARNQSTDVSELGAEPSALLPPLPRGVTALRDGWRGDLPFGFRLY